MVRQRLPWKAAQGLVLNAQVFYYFFLKGDWEEAVKVPLITFAGIAKSDGQLQPSTRKGECSPQIGHRGALGLHWTLGRLIGNLWPVLAPTT